MSNGAIALDVGGTSIKAAFVEAGGRILDGTASTYPSRAKETKEVIVSHLLDIVREKALPFEGAGSVRGVAMAFPGPFDYARGISLMRGIDKFDSLYGVDVGRELRQRVSNDPRLLSCFAADWHIVFENDVRAFALGQVKFGQASVYGRCLCLTIGTGLGSAFLEHGRIVTDGEGVPPEGWLYNQPFLEGTIDRYISRRGILGIARELGFNTETHDVKELALLAYQGNREALDVFERFGSLLAAALKPYADRFRPEAVILGGQIAKSSDLFLEAFKRDVSRSIEVLPVENTSRSAFLGVVSLL
jgi:glucokinase